MGNSRKIALAVFVFVFGTSIIGCGGGGGSSGEPAQTKTLHWTPPTEFTDGEPLNASTDLDSFEIFLNQDGRFSHDDPPDAAIAAADPGTGRITTSFDLANLAPFVSKGATYYISVRAVAKSGLKSDFSPSATFSY